MKHHRIFFTSVNKTTNDLGLHTVEIGLKIDTKFRSAYRPKLQCVKCSVIAKLWKVQSD